MFRTALYTLHAALNAAAPVSSSSAAVDDDDGTRLPWFFRDPISVPPPPIRYASSSTPVQLFLSSFLT